MYKPLSICVSVLLLSSFAVAQEQPAKENKDEALYKGKPASFWIKQLKDRDVSFRLDAVKALREIGTEGEGVVLALVKTLADKEQTVREAALEAISSLPLEGRIPALVQILRGKDASVRPAVIDLLGKIGFQAKDAIPDLTKALVDEDAYIRTRAADALGKIGVPARPKTPSDSDDDPFDKKFAAKNSGNSNAKKIVGVWVLSKSEAGGTLGDMMEFRNDGKLKIIATLPVGKVTADLIYKIEGNKLTWTLKGPPRDSTEILTIKSLTDSVLVTVDSKDRSQEFTRKGASKAVDFIEPTDEQLQAAVKAFEERKCTLFKHQDPETKRTSYYFTLPKEANDFSLGQLPDVPFSFGLVLNDTNVTDAGFPHLAKMKNLTELLILKSFHITDAGMKDIARLNALTTLTVNCFKVTDAGLKELAALENLVDLGFQEAKITDAGLKELVNFKSLTAISVASPLVTDAGVKELAKLSNLTGIGLATTKVTDNGLKELTALTKLKKMNLFETQVTDAGLSHIASMKTLTWLSLDKTQVTADGLAFIRTALPKCEILPAEPQKTGRPKAAIDLLFPLEGVTLGKTTVEELARLGKRPDKNIYKGIWHNFFVVNGVNFFHYEGNIAKGMSMTKYDKMPLPWQKLGFDFGLSYDGWLKLFASLGWEVKVLRQPKVVKYDFQKHNSLNAEVVATSGEIEMRLVFDNGTGETTAASGTLYSLGVHAKISPSPLTPQQKTAIAEIEKIGGKVTFDEAQIGRRVAAVSFKGTQVDDAGLKLLLPLTTVSRLDLCDTKVTDAGLKNVTSLRNLSSLVLNGTQVSDAGLKELKSFENLSVLSLCRTKVTDAGLMELAGLTNLSSLSLDDTMVTDGGLKSLAFLKENLSFLSLFGTKVTDAGLKDLAAFKRLTYLELRYTQVTETGIMSIRKQLPFSTIPFDR